MTSPGQHAGLDGGADGDHLVRVDALVGLAAGQLLDPLLHRGHAGHAAHEHDVVDLVAHARVGQGALGRAHEPLEQVVRQLLELGPGELQVEVLRAALVGRDERQVDLRRRGRRELDLGLLGRLVEALEGHLVVAQVDAVVALELGGHPVDDRLVEVVAAEVVVARGGLDLEHAVADLEHGHVERAAAEVEDQDRLVGLLVEPVGQRGRGRLVDDALDLEAGDRAGVLGGLPLGVVEVGRHRHDRVGHGLAEERLGVGLQLLQDHRADLLRAELLAVHLDPRVAVLPAYDLVGDDGHLLVHLGVLAAHEPLDAEDRVLGVRHRLALRDGTHQALAGLRESDDRRGRASALGVGEDLGLTAGENRHRGIGGAEVDADRLAHMRAASSRRDGPGMPCGNFAVTSVDLSRFMSSRI